jgi:glutathione synthase/RimK-type ligase-like ATP-grasp enzyme
MHSRAWPEVVVKPAVSGGSRQTVRVRPGDMDRGEAHWRMLLDREDVLVQPFQASVEGHGERAIVTVEGEPTHAVRKSPRFLGDPESVSDAVPIAPDEAALARQALAAAPETLLYGRVDVARGPDGAPRVMELELVEPSLFFRQCQAALDRYVAAVLRRLPR